MAFFLRAPKTEDENYKEAKNKLKTYSIESQYIIRAIQKLGLQLSAVSKYYSKFAASVIDWWPDATPAVKQSSQSVVTASNELDELSVNDFINKVSPNFITALGEYDDQVNALVELEKKRRAAVKEFDKARERLRVAQAAKEQNQEKIQQAQTQTTETQAVYEQANTEYIESVNKFGEQRKTNLLESFKIVAAIICQYINQATSLQTIPFPADLNGELAEKPAPSEKPTIEYPASSSHNEQAENNASSKAASTSAASASNSAFSATPSYSATPASNSAFSATPAYSAAPASNSAFSAAPSYSAAPASNSAFSAAPASNSPFSSNDNFFGSSQPTQTAAASNDTFPATSYTYDDEPIPTPDYQKSEPQNQSNPWGSGGSGNPFDAGANTKDDDDFNSNRNPFDANDDEDDAYGQNPFG